jgi:hypothetical protein
MCKVGELAARHGKRMAFWADMMDKRLDSVSNLPADSIANQWGYEDKEEFKGRLGKLETWVSPSASVHNSLFCRLDNAKLNIRGYAQRAQNLEGFMNTVWHNGVRFAVGSREAHGDEYYETLIGLAKHYAPPVTLPSAAWHGIAYGGECTWCLPPRNDPTFEQRLIMVLFGKDLPKAAEAWRLHGTSYKPVGMDGFDNSGMHNLYSERPGHAARALEADPEGIEECHRRIEVARAAWEELPESTLDSHVREELLTMAEAGLWTTGKVRWLQTGASAGAEWQELVERHERFVERFLQVHARRFPSVLTELFRRGLERLQEDYEGWGGKPE